MTPGERMDKIDQITSVDERYFQMILEVRRLEQHFSTVIDPLEIWERDSVWDYVMMCEEMSRYVLELACKNMIFPEEIL